jgi:hypothetical protein
MLALARERARIARPGVEEGGAATFGRGVVDAWIQKEVQRWSKLLAADRDPSPRQAPTVDDRLPLLEFVAVR